MLSCDVHYNYADALTTHTELFPKLLMLGLGLYSVPIDRINKCKKTYQFRTQYKAVIISDN